MIPSRRSSNVFRCAGRLSPMLLGKKQRSAVALLGVKHYFEGSNEARRHFITKLEQLQATEKRKFFDRE